MDLDEKRTTAENKYAEHEKFKRTRPLVCDVLHFFFSENGLCPNSI